MRRWLMAIAVLGVVPLLMAPSCQAGGPAVGVSAGGGTIVVAHPYVKRGGVWVKGSSHWWWIGGAAAGATLGALAEGVIPKGGKGHGSGVVGHVPFAKTGRCRNPNDTSVVEAWISHPHGHLWIDCQVLRGLWRSNARGIKGSDVLACITWMLFRGEGRTLGNGLAAWVYKGDRVVIGDSGRILSASPPFPTWEQCAQGQ